MSGPARRSFVGAERCVSGRAGKASARGYFPGVRPSLRSEVTTDVRSKRIALSWGQNGALGAGWERRVPGSIPGTRSPSNPEITDVRSSAPLFRGGRTAHLRRAGKGERPGISPGVVLPVLITLDHASGRTTVESWNTRLVRRLHRRRGEDRLSRPEVARVHRVRATRHLDAHAVTGREPVRRRPHRHRRAEASVRLARDRRRREPLEAVAHVHRTAVGIHVAHAHEEVGVVDARRHVQVRAHGPDDLERAIERVARVHEHIGSRLELAVVA